MLDDLIDRYHKKDRLALSRLLSLVARGERVGDIVQAISPSSPGARTRIVAITGSGGVGKSSLVGKLIELLRRKGLTVAVLACDPQSPLSGGALLGDRFRMPAQPDDGVFIRSLATAGGQGAVAGHVDAMLRVLESFGFDVILVETVGAGQGETTVRGLADVVVLLLQPETGDDLQWEKAGLLEVSDIVAIHKADLPGADSAEAQVRAVLNLSKAGQAVPVLRVSARTGTGLEELWSAITARPAASASDRRLPAHQEDADELLHIAKDLLSLRYQRAGDDPAVRELREQCRQGKAPEAAAALLRLLSQGEPGA